MSAGASKTFLKPYLSFIAGSGCVSVLSMAATGCFALSMGESFTETFDTFDQDRWLVSTYVNELKFIDTGWSADNVQPVPGKVVLEMNGADMADKNFTGGEFRTNKSDFFYGTYEVTMRPSGSVGVLSSFFVYTGPPFGDPKSEIDFEFVGADTTRVLLSHHTPEGFQPVWVDLGFDAAVAEHTYAFEWGPDYIRWYADGRLLREIEDTEIGIPSEPGRIFASIWTGSSDFTGIARDDVVTFAEYSNISFTARTAPIAAADQFEVKSGAPLSMDVLANDTALQGKLVPESIKIAVRPEHGAAGVDAATGRILYTSAQDFRGTDILEYTVSDGAETSNTGKVMITVD